MLTASIFNIFRHAELHLCNALSCVALSVGSAMDCQLDVAAIHQLPGDRSSRFCLGDARGM